MKISPVPTLGNVQSVDAQGSRVDSIRNLKMNTDATPGPKEAPPVEEVSISDVNEDKAEPAVEATEPISPQFAALAKQRRALQQERRAFEDEKKAAALKSQGSDQVPLARLKSEPLSVLLEAGVTYEQLTEAILANNNNPEVTRLKTEMNDFKSDIDKRLSDEKAQSEKQALAEMRRDADALIVNNDDYELVRTTRSVPDVMKLIERTYRETGEVLAVSEALKLVEDELFKRNQALVNTKKLQGLFNKPAEQTPAAPQQRAPGMRTLTNKDTASVPMDRRARALAAALGQPIRR